jgi:hypothetical protein
MNGERLRILLAGMVAGDPRQGGASWAVLQYVAGLSELGHEVVLVEPVAAEALEPAGGTVGYFESLPLLEGRAALLGDGRETVGMGYRELLEFARGADLLLNISGMLRDQPLLEAVSTRAFLDLDPGFNQVWQEAGAEMGIDLHTHFVTVGVRIGTEDCPIPTLGRNWIPTLPPVALPHWPPADDPPSRNAFTSVGHWRSYGSIEHQGVHYGQRAHALRELFDLPRRVDASFELALGIHSDEVDDLQALREHGWGLLDPDEVAATPAAYADFVRGSKAELCVAKSGYVNSRSGWFSDRSACYLASGRPVAAQDTGFGKSLPVGEGLLAYSSTKEAAAAVTEIERDYGRHSRAARALGEEHLDANKVLPRLLERLAAPEPSAADR